MICGLSHIFLTIKLESLAPGMKCLQKTRKSTKFKTLTPCPSSIFKIFDINCLLAQRHSTGEFEGERFSMISTSNGKITKIAPLMLFNLKKTSQAKRRLSQCSCSFFFVLVLWVNYITILWEEGQEISSATPYLQFQRIVRLLAIRKGRRRVNKFLWERDWPRQKISKLRSGKPP